MVWNFHPIVGNKINLEIHSIEGEPSNIVSVAVNEVKFHIEDKIICFKHNNTNTILVQHMSR